MQSLLDKIIKDLTPEVVKLRREFHSIPEVGFREYNTSKKIAEYLRECGLEVFEGVGETGVVGLLKGNKEGKTIAIRADIDALPIKEETCCDFKSQNEGYMHACGHDGHIAIALCAAKVISKMKDKLNGNVKFIFQPAEEILQGAQKMLEDNVLENPSVDAIIGLHIWPEIESGSIGIRKGPIMAATDRFDITIKGVGGHGALPNLAVDPIVVGAQVLTALQTIVSREIHPLEGAVISNCIFNSGTVFNAIPDKANLAGTVRCFNDEVRHYIDERLKRMVAGITDAMRCDFDYKYTYGIPATVNDNEFTEKFKRLAEGVLGKDKVIEIKTPSMGGEDFSLFLKEIPGTFFFLGTGEKSEGKNLSIHHPKYLINEEILPVGVKLFCNAVFDYLD